MFRVEQLRFRERNRTGSECAERLLVVLQDRGAVPRALGERIAAQHALRRQRRLLVVHRVLYRPVLREEARSGSELRTYGVDRKAVARLALRAAQSQPEQLVALVDDLRDARRELIKLVPLEAARQPGHRSA